MQENDNVSVASDDRESDQQKQLSSSPMDDDGPDLEDSPLKSFSPKKVRKTLGPHKRRVHELIGEDFGVWEMLPMVTKVKVPS